MWVRKKEGGYIGGKEGNKRERKKMSTKRQKEKRETKQIRVSGFWHKALKLEAVEKETTISKLADEILSVHFKGRILDTGRGMNTTESVVSVAPAR